MLRSLRGAAGAVASTCVRTGRQPPSAGRGLVSISCSGPACAVLLPQRVHWVWHETTEGRRSSSSHWAWGFTAAAAAAATASVAVAVPERNGGRTATRCEPTARGTNVASGKPVLVVGSLNADIIIEINRFPKPGETLGTRSPDTGIMVPGGKGANQAVAAARLSASTGRQVHFVCQFGNDSHAKKLEQVLLDNKLDISGCGHVDKPSGQAFIFLEANGSNSILIVGGSNVAWPPTVKSFEGLIRGASAVLLQREVPEYVNEAVADVAFAAGVPVIQDVGGEERPISDNLMRKLTYICPNETELERLSGMPTSTEKEIIAAARSLQQRGVKNVLITLGADGSLLVGQDGQVLRQGSRPVPGGRVVDTTGAGDCFRAAFTIALVEGRPLLECMKFAAAAGAITVSRMGAIPSLPAREECQALAGSGSH